MASPPYATSPSGMSPPYPSPAQIPSKKRSSGADANAPPHKRRKPSNLSQASVAAAAANHPLRQTSFPPEARSPYPRSPSVDAQSHVSGSAVSTTASGAPKKKRGRKAKNAKQDDSSEATPSLVGGRAPTAVSGQGGEKEDDDEDDEKAEMALEDVVARTQEQKQEEIRLRAMLVEAFDSQQYNRYELWRAAKLADSVVKRVSNIYIYFSQTITNSYRSSTQQSLNQYPKMSAQPSRRLPSSLQVKSLKLRAMSKASGSTQERSKVNCPRRHSLQTTTQTQLRRKLISSAAHCDLIIYVRPGDAIEFLERVEVWACSSSGTRSKMMELIVSQHVRESDSSSKIRQGIYLL